MRSETAGFVVAALFLFGCAFAATEVVRAAAALLG